MENPMENPHENPIAGAVADVDSEASGASCCASGFFFAGDPLGIPGTGGWWPDGPIGEMGWVWMGQGMGQNLRRDDMEDMEDMEDGLDYVGGSSILFVLLASWSKYA